MDMDATQLKDMKFTDLILSKSALNNVVENKDLKNILNEYVPLSSFNKLESELERIKQEYMPISSLNAVLSSFQEFKDISIKALSCVEQLKEQLNGFRLNVIDSEYVSDTVLPNTLTFVLGKDESSNECIQAAYYKKIKQKADIAAEDDSTAAKTQDNAINPTINPTIDTAVASNFKQKKKKGAK